MSNSSLILLSWGMFLVKIIEFTSWLYEALFANDKVFFLIIDNDFVDFRSMSLHIFIIIPSLIINTWFLFITIIV